VTGAYGLIGSACLARLHQDGHELIGAGRDIVGARRRFAFAQWVEADFNRLTSVQDWRPLLTGIDAVVNCVGVLQDGFGDNAERVHVQATGALFDACRAQGVRRVVHISAIGASDNGPSAYSQTKRQVETHLANLDLDWVVLRPALLLSTAVYGGTAMLRGLAAMPGLIVMIGGQRRVQVIGIDDLTETVARSLRPDAPVRVTWDLAHPQVLTLADIVRALRDWLGYPRRPVVQLPIAMEWIITHAADALGWLGWRSPARSTAMAELSAGVLGDPTRWMAATGVRPKSLADILAQRPASVQDRWFARLYLLKPIAIAGLALFWVVSGLIALGPGRREAMALLVNAGVSAAIAGAAVMIGALIDIVLGLAILFRPAARAALVAMLAVTAVYAVMATLLVPQLWTDPLGPLVKMLPAVLAMLFTLAIVEGR